MFCPACSAYLSERDVIKTGVKYAPGNIPVEYEAQCPKCSADMGKVSWGQLTVNPELASKTSAPAFSAEPATGESLSRSARSKACPHCGKPLPEGY